MPLTSREKLRIIAPEQADTGDAVVDFHLSIAASRVGAGAFGDLYEQGVLYLAAHLLTLRDRGMGGTAAGGALASVKTGDLSVGFAGVMGSGGGDESLHTTTYGREFLAIRTQAVAGPYIG